MTTFFFFFLGGVRCEALGLGLLWKEGLALIEVQMELLNKSWTQTPHGLFVFSDEQMPDAFATTRIDCVGYLGGMAALVCVCVNSQTHAFPRHTRKNSKILWKTSFFRANFRNPMLPLLLAQFPTPPMSYRVLPVEGIFW